MTEDPVELIPGIALQLLRKGFIVREQRHRLTGGGGQRRDTRVFALPPRRSFAVVREEEAGALHAVFQLNQLARIAKRVIALFGDRQLKAQRAFYRLADVRLLRLRRDARVLQQRDHRQTGIGRMEERAFFAVGTPVVMPVIQRRQSRHQALRALLRRSQIDRFLRGAIQLGSRQQRGIIIHNVLFAVIHHAQVIFLQEGEGIFCGLQILLPREIAVILHGAGQRQRGN